MYDVRKGRPWTLDAPIFGIAFGARHFSVHIELPGGASVRPEGYRQFFRYTTGEQQQVYAADFARIAVKNRPQWLIDLIRKFAPDSPAQEDIRKEPQKLLDELRVQRSSPRQVENIRIDIYPREGQTFGNVRRADVSSTGTKQREDHLDFCVIPVCALMTCIWKIRDRAPVIIPLRKEEEIDEKQIKERAARYYDNGQLFVNMLYPSIQLMKEQLEREYADASAVDQMR